MSKKWILLAPLAILAMLVCIAIGGEVVGKLWNWLLPPLFGWRQISFGQAVGILALCRILFGGWGRRGFRRFSFRRRMERWQRWQHRTPEERERFRQSIRQACGARPSA